MLPQEVWDAFRRKEREANVMYPHALKAASIEGGTDLQFWITCSTFSNASTKPSLDLVLSCTHGPIGSYPLFIFSSSPADMVNDQSLYPRIDVLINTLLQVVPTSRVFSIFAPEPVARVFVELWTRYTGIRSYPDPYYAAKLTFCTSETLMFRHLSDFRDTIYTPRLAREDDLRIVAELCQGFASTSVSC